RTNRIYCSQFQQFVIVEKFGHLVGDIFAAETIGGLRDSPWPGLLLRSKIEGGDRPQRDNKRKGKTNPYHFFLNLVIKKKIITADRCYCFLIIYQTQQHAQAIVSYTTLLRVHTI